MFFFFLKLIWRYYYKCKSSAEHGTLYQLRNAINRTNVVSDPLKDFNACDDFFVLVVQSHIIVAAMQLLGMSTMDEMPSSHYVPNAESLWMETDDQRKGVLNRVAMGVVDSFVNLSFNSLLRTDDSPDKIYLHANCLLSLGCLYLEFRDAIKEGDGERVIRCYRYMLPMFKGARRKNYSIESLNLLVQYDFSLSPRQAAELLWGRFINVHGIPGRNISNDLHMEHLNRLVKAAIKGLGSNKTKKAILRTGKALGVVAPVLDNFDQDNHLTEIYSSHKSRNVEKDLNILVKELSSVFTQIQGRYHKSFPNPKHPLHLQTIQELKSWISSHIH